MTGAEAPKAKSEPAKRAQTLSKPLYTQLATANLRSEGRGLEGQPGEYEVAIVFRHPIQASGIDDELQDASEI